MGLPFEYGRELIEEIVLLSKRRALDKQDEILLFVYFFAVQNHINTRYQSYNEFKQACFLGSEQVEKAEKPSARKILDQVKSIADLF